MNSGYVWGETQIGCQLGKEVCCNQQVIMIIMSMTMSTWTLHLSWMVHMDYEGGCVDYVIRVGYSVVLAMMYASLY